MRSSAPGRVLAALAALLALWPAAAGAHVGKQAKAIQVRVTESKLVLIVTWDVNAGDDARVVRATYDRNQDGRLDGEELAVLEAFLGRNATTGLVLSRGGSDVVPKLLEQKFFGLDLPVGAADALGIHASFELDRPVGKGQDGVEIRLEDKSVPPNLELDVPVVVDIDHGVVIVFANMGELSLKERRIKRVLINRSAPFVIRTRSSAGV